MLHPASVSSVMHTVGISSSATALQMKPDNLLAANLFNGQMVNYWNLWDYEQNSYTFVDGGGLRHGGLNAAHAPETFQCCKCGTGSMMQCSVMDARPVLTMLFACICAGAVDDLAIMPLLRRGVKNIIVCVATRTEPTGTLAEFATG